MKSNADWQPGLYFVRTENPNDGNWSSIGTCGHLQTSRMFHAHEAASYVMGRRPVACAVLVKRPHNKAQVDRSPNRRQIKLIIPFFCLTRQASETERQESRPPRSRSLPPTHIISPYQSPIYQSTNLPSLHPRPNLLTRNRHRVRSRLRSRCARRWQSPAPSAP